MGAIYWTCLFLIDREQATRISKWLTLIFSKAMQKIWNKLAIALHLSLNNFISRVILLAVAQLLVTSWLHVKAQRKLDVNGETYASCLAYFDQTLRYFQNSISEKKHWNCFKRNQIYGPPHQVTLKPLRVVSNF